VPDSIALPTIAYAIDGDDVAGLTTDEKIKLQRQPASAAHMFRKLLGAGIANFKSREASIICCKAEMEWARNNWRAIAADMGLNVLDPKEQTWGAPAWQLTLLPHEAAAQIVVNIWSEHVSRHEDGARRSWARLKAQRAAGWNTVETAKDVRWYLAERRKLMPKLKAAIERYAKLREALDRTPTGPACAKREAA
jgi:hypothetical protein